jgi:hypothetical protein
VRVGLDVARFGHARKVRRHGIARQVDMVAGARAPDATTRAALDRHRFTASPTESRWLAGVATRSRPCRTSSLNRTTPYPSPPSTRMFPAAFGRDLPLQPWVHLCCLCSHCS